ncbi:hypothetical protein ACH47B_06485 [Rhodococcus sp. NPDC019627]|uniref:hypothetical protein n=1 Tax=unclassified Rhodococcus (in: high G+C Gram-positive bacteria) TaxID=192944 RepID=UPI0037AFC68E
MGTTITAAVISVLGVIVAALVGGLGHLLARRSEKDDDVRQWVELRFREQAAENGRLNARIDGLEAELRREKEEHGVSRRESRALARYVREVCWYFETHVPVELGLRLPEPTGLAREVMERG